MLGVARNGQGCGQGNRRLDMHATHVPSGSFQFLSPRPHKVHAAQGFEGARTREGRAGKGARGAAGCAPGSGDWFPPWGLSASRPRFLTPGDEATAGGAWFSREKKPPIAPKGTATPRSPKGRSQNVLGDEGVIDGPSSPGKKIFQKSDELTS